MLGWMYLIPFGLFFVVQGRSYYLAPAYPMLIAAGVVAWQQRLASRPARPARRVWRTAWGALAVGGTLGGAFMLPMAPINSRLWAMASQVHDNFREQIGWPELVQTVAEMYHAQSVTEPRRVAILTGNYGEAG